ncbi:phosphatidylinositol-binding protein scs2 [Aspergillus fumigatus]|nr:hypothetical protein KXW70_003371 [Aspergillus fumigatus]KAH2992179.1 hypothetical protein KXW58_007374 [Aspergillus fumigatus]
MWMSKVDPYLEASAQPLMGVLISRTVLLQAMKEEPAPDAKCKDKFLVQTVAVTGDMEFSNVSSIFEKASKSSIQERKIRVNWLPAESSKGEQGKDPNGISAPEEEPPSYTSPGANYQTPAVGASTKFSNDTSPIPPPDFSEKPKRDAFAQQSNETSATSVKSNTSGIPASADELKAQLSEANAQIQKLKERLADQGLRQRKIGGDNEKSTPTMQQQQVQPDAAGVPLQIVAGLCLLSFLIAYFFF